ncbi:putative glycoside hydrolase [Podospora australis]|uniref:Mannan endo-1,6-alpha-mannosidase n=1 Tax=Podospora australis TaxID=1536484 RepID=A0AAN6WND6_9PEZI|nr:putative glycoside hydrolase [Podospora australis]
MRLSGLFFGAVTVLVQRVTAVDLVLRDEASVKSAASSIAFGLVKYYTGNNTGDVPGNLPDPYFWWEAGAMFGTLIDYWALTGDDSYNAITSQAMLHQGSDTRDFMPVNQTRTLGNDDQGFWAMTAMTAAELKFPDPPKDQAQWLALAQATFNQYASRWDTATCGGGLRWQIFNFNTGFNYKNSISNGCFFNIAARLARFTGNQTYAEWAAKVWDWQESMNLFRDGDVLDGVGIKQVNGEEVCPDHIDQIQWSYNAGIFLHGAAAMYNFTDGNPIWKRRVDEMLNSTTEAFYNTTAVNSDTPVLHEQFCESHVICNIDQRSFKGYLTRWMARTTQLVPHTYDVIYPLLESSAKAAARACSGTTPAPAFKGHPGTACGFSWTTGGFDGLVGVGEQMNALSAIASTLIDRTAAPVTADTGGTSSGDPAGGANGPGSSPVRELRAITTGDRVAAGFLTSAIALSIVAGCAFVMI